MRESSPATCYLGIQEEDKDILVHGILQTPKYSLNLNLLHGPDFSVFGVKP